MTGPDFSKGINGLLPVIAQDASTHQVLMFAWMNQEAYTETIETGFATYFSRSRNRLWRKGEESGHRQEIVELRIDCDADCILLRVNQLGAACHEGYVSCFFRKIANGDFTIDLERIIEPASVYKSPKS